MVFTLVGGQSQWVEELGVESQGHTPYPLFLEGNYMGVPTVENGSSNPLWLPNALWLPVSNGNCWMKIDVEGLGERVNKRWMNGSITQGLMNQTTTLNNLKAMVERIRRVNGATATVCLHTSESPLVGGTYPLPSLVRGDLEDAKIESWTTEEDLDATIKSWGTEITKQFYPYNGICLF